MLQTPKLKFCVVTFSFPPEGNTGQFLLSYWPTNQNDQVNVFWITLLVTHNWHSSKPTLSWAGRQCPLWMWRAGPPSALLAAECQDWENEGGLSCLAIWHRGHSGDMSNFAFQVQNDRWQYTVNMSNLEEYIKKKRPTGGFLSLNGSHWKVMQTRQLWNI